MNNKKRYDYVILPSFEKDMREIQDYIIYRLQNPWPQTIWYAR